MAIKSKSSPSFCNRKWLLVSSPLGSHWNKKVRLSLWQTFDKKVLFPFVTNQLTASCCLLLANWINKLFFWQHEWQCQHPEHSPTLKQPYMVESKKILILWPNWDFNLANCKKVMSLVDKIDHHEIHEILAYRSLFVKRVSPIISRHSQCPHLPEICGCDRQTEVNVVLKLSTQTVWSKKRLNKVLVGRLFVSSVHRQFIAKVICSIALGQVWIVESIRSPKRTCSWMLVVQCVTEKGCPGDQKRGGCGLH